MIGHNNPPPVPDAAELRRERRAVKGKIARRAASIDRMSDEMRRMQWRLDWLDRMLDERKTGGDQ